MQSQNPQTEDQQEFEATLGALVRAAARAGVDVSRTSDVPADGTGYWKIEISRVSGADPRLGDGSRYGRDASYDDPWFE